MADMKQAIESVRRSLDQIVELSKTLSDKELHWKPAEDKWSVQEVLAHVEEAIPYWLREVETLLRSPGTPWGRTLQDPVRLQAVAEAPNRPTAEILNNIAAVKPEVERVLAGITDEQLAAVSPSRNPRFGDKPLSFVIDHLLVEHAEIHRRQIERNLAQYREAVSGQ